MQNGRRGGRDIAVEHHGHPLQPRGEDGAGHRRDLPATEACQDRQRVAEMILVGVEREPHGLRLAGEAGRIEAGAAPDPVLGLAAVERGVDRRRDRGVADAHLADREAIGARRHRLHAEGHGGDAPLLVEGRAGADVAGRQIHGEVEHPEAEAVGGAELVDRRPPGGEVVQHLPVDRGREGRDAALHHAVAAGEHADHRPVEGGLGLALPRAKPFHETFEPPERARRLGEAGIPRPDRGDRVPIGAGHLGEQAADVGEGRGVGGRAGGHRQGSCASDAGKTKEVARSVRELPPDSQRRRVAGSRLPAL